MKPVRRIRYQAIRHFTVLQLGGFNLKPAYNFFE